MKAFAFFIGLLALLLMPTSTFAHSYKQGDIRIGHVWTRATPPSALNAAIYFPLLNTGAKADKFIGASMKDAAKVEIHQTLEQGGVMKMVQLAFIPLEPNKPVTLKPKGMHVMAFGLKHPLKAGDMVPLTLQFEKAGSIEVKIMVEAEGTTPTEH